MKPTVKSLSRRLLKVVMVCVVALQGANAKAQTASPAANQTPVTAIDILLGPFGTAAKRLKSFELKP